jgi:uncharacterized membrane protein YphA (DoxX/SURF4 family)
MSQLSPPKWTGSERWQEWLIVALRICLGLVFLQSSIAKFDKPYDFLSSVYSYHLLGSDTGFTLAFALPWIEFACACSLLTGVLLHGGFLATTSLLTIFTFAKASAVHRNLEIGCGCQLVSVGEIVGLTDVLVTITLLLMSIIALALLSRQSRFQVFQEKVA